MGSECSDTSESCMSVLAGDRDYVHAVFILVHAGVHGACRLMDVYGLRPDLFAGWSVDVCMNVTLCIGAHTWSFVAMAELSYHLVWVSIKDG